PRVPARAVPGTGRAHVYLSFSHVRPSGSPIVATSLQAASRKLAISRARLTNPRLLILDEATEGLAPIVCDPIWRTVRLIRATGMATLIVDKRVSAVTEIADRIVILVKGETMFEGAAPELTTNPGLMHRHLGV